MQRRRNKNGARVLEASKRPASNNDSNHLKSSNTNKSGVKQQNENHALSRNKEANKINYNNSNNCNNINTNNNNPVTATSTICEQSQSTPNVDAKSNKKSLTHQPPNNDYTPPINTKDSILINNKNRAREGSSVAKGFTRQRSGRDDNLDHVWNKNSNQKPNVNSNKNEKFSNHYKRSDYQHPPKPLIDISFNPPKPNSNKQDLNNNQHQNQQSSATKTATATTTNKFNNTSSTSEFEPNNYTTRIKTNHNSHWQSLNWPQGSHLEQILNKAALYRSLSSLTPRASSQEDLEDEEQKQQQQQQDEVVSISDSDFGLVSHLASETGSVLESVASNSDCGYDFASLNDFQSEHHYPSKLFGLSSWLSSSSDNNNYSNEFVAASCNSLERGTSVDDDDNVDITSTINDHQQITGNARCNMKSLGEIARNSLPALSSLQYLGAKVDIANPHRNTNRVKASCSLPHGCQNDSSSSSGSISSNYQGNNDNINSNNNTDNNSNKINNPNKTKHHHSKKMISKSRLNSNSRQGSAKSSNNNFSNNNISYTSYKGRLISAGSVTKQQQLFQQRNYSLAGSKPSSASASASGSVSAASTQLTSKGTFLDLLRLAGPTTVLLQAGCESRNSSRRRQFDENLESEKQQLGKARRADSALHSMSSLIDEQEFFRAIFGSPSCRGSSSSNSPSNMSKINITNVKSNFNSNKTTSPTTSIPTATATTTTSTTTTTSATTTITTAYAKSHSSVAAKTTQQTKSALKFRIEDNDNSNSIQIIGIHQDQKDENMQLKLAGRLNMSQATRLAPADKSDSMRLKSNCASEGTQQKFLHDGATGQRPHSSLGLITATATLSLSPSSKLKLKSPTPSSDKRKRKRTSSLKSLFCGGKSKTESQDEENEEYDVRIVDGTLTVPLSFNYLLEQQQSSSTSIDKEPQKSNLIANIKKLKRKNESNKNLNSNSSDNDTSFESVGKKTPDDSDRRSLKGSPGKAKGKLRSSLSLKKSSMLSSSWSRLSGRKSSSNKSKNNENDNNSDTSKTCSGANDMLEPISIGSPSAAATGSVSCEPNDDNNGSRLPGGPIIYQADDYYGGAQDDRENASIITGPSRDVSSVWSLVNDDDDLENAIYTSTLTDPIVKTRCRMLVTPEIVLNRVEFADSSPSSSNNELDKQQQGKLASILLNQNDQSSLLSCNLSNYSSGTSPDLRPQTELDQVGSESPRLNPTPLSETTSKPEIENQLLEDSKRDENIIVEPIKTNLVQPEQDKQPIEEASRITEIDDNVVTSLQDKVSAEMMADSLLQHLSNDILSSDNNSVYPISFDNNHIETWPDDDLERGQNSISFCEKPTEDEAEKAASSEWIQQDLSEDMPNVLDDPLISHGSPMEHLICASDDVITCDSDQVATTTISPSEKDSVMATLPEEEEAESDEPSSIGKRFLRACSAAMNAFVKTMPLNVLLLLFVAGIFVLPMLQKDACCELSARNEFPCSLNQVSFRERPT